MKIGTLLAKSVALHFLLDFLMFRPDGLARVLLKKQIHGRKTYHLAHKDGILTQAL